MEQGLLDLAVELSTRDITAGNEFALFVLVKNPFSRPIWIREVNVSLPSELRLADEDKLKKKLKETEAKHESGVQEALKEQTELSSKLDALQDQLSELASNLNADNASPNLSHIIEQLGSSMRDFQDRVARAKVGIATVQIFEGAQVEAMKIGSNTATVQIYGMDAAGHAATVRQLEIYEPWLIREELTEARTVKLKSSLPDNAALQPGSTGVYTAVLNIKRSLIFTPSKYRLQFYVNYGFSPATATPTTSSTEDLFTNTVAHELSIRPSVYSVIYGSVLGGLVGAVARLLQISSTVTWQSSAVSIFLSVILSAMAVIFMARKSDTQSFVSIEDFWGGVLIGFLVGYTGTSFFESLTGIAKPTG